MIHCTFKVIFFVSLLPGNLMKLFSKPNRMDHFLNYTFLKEKDFEVIF